MKIIIIPTFLLIQNKIKIGGMGDSSSRSMSACVKENVPAVTFPSFQKSQTTPEIGYVCSRGFFRPLVTTVGLLSQRGWDAF